ncbi:MAG TPA: IclR family transcriptional regulator [Mycobacteriales bacterium]|nr:IclR family transcriptional regulator [Mycobacteriales bacterium]
MDSISGVGVIDKAVAVLAAVGAGEDSLAALAERTGLPRATAHRLATALESHRLLDRDGDRRWVIGSLWAELAGMPVDDLAVVAQPYLDALRDLTDESAQLFVRRGDGRVCVAASDRRSGLRDTVPVGAVLPMTAGSGAKVLLAWAPADDRSRLLAASVFTAASLADVRRHGWATSVGEREDGVASVSVPVHRDGSVVAALCVSGPVERLTRAPGRRFGAVVRDAALALERSVHGGT